MAADDGQRCRQCVDVAENPDFAGSAVTEQSQSGHQIDRIITHAVVDCDPARLCSRASDFNDGDLVRNATQGGFRDVNIGTADRSDGDRCSVGDADDANDLIRCAAGRRDASAEIDVRTGGQKQALPVEFRSPLQVDHRSRRRVGHDLNVGVCCIEPG